MVDLCNATIQPIFFPSSYGTWQSVETMNVTFERLTTPQKNILNNISSLYQTILHQLYLVTLQYSINAKENYNVLANKKIASRTQCACVSFMTTSVWIQKGYMQINKTVYNEFQTECKPLFPFPIYICQEKANNLQHIIY